MLGLLVVWMFQHFHEPCNDRGIAPLQRFNCLLSEIIAQHILGIGAAHPLITLIRRTTIQAQPRDITAQPAGQAAKLLGFECSLLIVECLPE